ncbi:MAG: TetR/AcrR family transcriptional regulator [Rhizobiaceae bacterium]|nr:TetR/AcrR family transcriptional regulator [Rhizobiaceae bacterium]
MDEAIAAIVQAISDIEGPLPPKKRAIVEQAVLTFAEKGFDAASTKEIAQRAGVAEATIFRHFATKEDLLLRLVQPVVSRVVVPAATEQFERVMAAEKGRVEDVLRVVLKERLGVIRRFAPLIRILIQEIPFRPELQKVLFSQIPAGLGGALAMMQREMDSGRMRREPPTRIARWIASLFGGYFIASTIFAPGPGWDDDAEVDALVGVLAHGILKVSDGDGPQA